MYRGGTCRSLGYFVLMLSEMSSSQMHQLMSAIIHYFFTKGHFLLHFVFIFIYNALVLVLNTIQLIHMCKIFNTPNIVRTALEAQRISFLISSSSANKACFSPNPQTVCHILFFYIYSIIGTRRYEAVARRCHPHFALEFVS